MARQTRNGLLSRHDATQRLGTGDAPHHHLVFDFLNKHIWGPRPVLKDAGVPLQPNFPRDKHGDGGQCFSMRSSLMDGSDPPILDVLKCLPRRHIEVMQPQPLFKGGPNPLGEPTLKEQMGGRLGNMIAQLAKTAVWHFIISALLTVSVLIFGK